jgi:hypothetical protein
MHKNFFIASLAALALGACSSSGNTGTTGTSGSGSTTGGSTTGGESGITVTFTTVTVHPAAVAALNDAGFPVPSITSGAYEIAMDGVSLNTADLQNPIVLNDAGITTITSTTGPYTFALSQSFLLDDAPLGVIGIVRPTFAAPGDGGLPQATCAQFAELSAGVSAYIAAGAGEVVPDFLLDAGFTDYLMPTGLEVDGQAVAPSADVSNAIAYAIPMSYAVMLNCAGNHSKTTRDTDTGVALIYVTTGAGPSLGAPATGAVVSVANAAGSPTATYYASNYSSSDTTGTDSTGIATFVGVAPASETPPTMTVRGVAGSTYTAPYGISTQPNAFFSILAYPH